MRIDDFSLNFSKSLFEYGGYLELSRAIAEGRTVLEHP